MIKKLISVFFITFFLLFFLAKGVFASNCNLPISWCGSKIGPPSSTCCRSSSCSGTKCGTISKWQYCYAYACCATLSQKCTHAPYQPECYYDFYYNYRYSQCSAADSCNGSIYLQPGLCLSSGCAKGGNYKICCKDDRSGATCQYY